MMSPLLQRQGFSQLLANLLAYWQRYNYRWLTGLVVLLALALTMLIPYDRRGLLMPEPWSYDIASQSFAQGKWTLNTDEISQARTQVHLQGGRLTQYVEIAPDMWAFRQSPGFPLQAMPFVTLRIPHLVNAFLAILVTLVLYPALAAWRGERLAFLGITLMLWSPISLLALHYTNMDTFAGGMWPLVAGALLLWYEAQDRERRATAPVLGLAGFAAGWSIVVRITSLPLLAVLGGYGLYLIWAKRPLPKTRRHRQRPKQRQPRTLDRTSKWHLVAFVGGGLLALGILLAYNYLTFGSVLDNGYLYPSPYESHNLWSEKPLTEVPGGVDTWLAGGTLGDIIVTLFMHLRLWLRPASYAWPLWPLAVWGLIRLFRQRPLASSSWFTGFWLIMAYAPYAGVIFFGVTRALAVPYDQGWGFFIPARYLYTLMLPFVWTVTAVLARYHYRWVWGLVGVYVVGSTWLFLATLGH